MGEYQLTASDAVIRDSDKAYIPNDPANRDREEYDKWLADGGVPDPYVEPPPPEPVPDALAEAQRANARLDAGVEAAQETVVKQEARPAIIGKTGEVTREEFDALTARVDAIQAAVTAMIDAQAQT